MGRWYWVFVSRMTSAAFVALGLASCTSFDPLNHTVEKINTDATSYGYNAILLNVVHAERREPLTFVTITGLDGTDTLQGTLGVPAFVFGPHAATTPRDITLGATSVSRTGSNLVHVTVVSDPATFAALMAPVNPAQIAFFTAQGYDSTLLFFMLVDRIQQVSDDGSVAKQWTNDPDLNQYYDKEGKLFSATPTAADITAGVHNPFQDFITELGDLLDEGLTAQADVTVEPTGRALPPSRLCMDPSVRPSFNYKRDPNFKNLCKGAAWVESTTSSAGSSSSGGSGTGGASIAVAPNGSLWVVRSEQAILVNQAGAQPAIDIKKPAQPYQEPRVAFGFKGQNGEHFQLFLRSVYGAYGYLGALRRNGTNLSGIFKVKMPHPADWPANESWPDSLIVLTAAHENCFAEVDYKNEHYCAPDDAPNTKIAFGTLQLLQQLDTAPPPAPTTLTVHEVP